MKAPTTAAKTLIRQFKWLPHIATAMTQSNVKMKTGRIGINKRGKYGGFLSSIEIKKKNKNV
jgi:hypothetical protein